MGGRVKISFLHMQLILKNGRLDDHVLGIPTTAVSAMDFFQAVEMVTMMYTY